MANFFYKAKDKNGKIAQGTFNATSLSDAANKLEQKGFVVLEIKEEIKKQTANFSNIDFSQKTTLSIQEKKDFFNSFYSLYKSGSSVLQVFELIHDSTKSEKVKALCANILIGIKKGYSLKDSIKPCAKALGTAYAMLIVAGEESGKLEEILSSIIKNLITQEKIKNDVISKSAYPALMFFLAIFVALLFKTFIIEVFTQSASGAKVCIASLALKAAIQIGIVFLAIAGVIYAIYKNKALLSKIISKLIAFKPIGNLVRNYSYSNFFSVLTLAYSAGLSLAEALNLAASVVNMPEDARILKIASARVQQGCELTTALSATNLFSEYAISQISTGEKAGELEKMLHAVSYDYESKLRVSLEVILKLLEPMMIFAVGIIVLIVAINGYKSYYAFLFSF